MKTHKRKYDHAPLLDSEIDLRLWCIEQAIHWPVYTSYGGQFGGTSQSEEADVIGRAKRIFDWVCSR